MTVDRGTGGSAAARGGARRLRGGNYPDILYGEVRVAAWAESLLRTRPFQRLAHISLSDVPGELLFERRFPSRLEHTRGVYFLARLARPRDRTLQAAALAHDLGHGPFSHLTEPLMRERLDEDHEERAARLLERVRTDLSDSVLRQLGWLDWDEIAHLVIGGGRGALLNGKLDYDNADNVARFLLAANLGLPGYDPRTLARALRLRGRLDVAEPPATEDMPHASYDGHARGEAVYLLAHMQEDALAWREDRARVYNYLHAGHRNLALHAMLRKSIDLIAVA
ncbi:MAG TPA: HD domain-containing protein, partial [Ktedonobacterales bacterium]|nr:HD domain-containing protein [Ktedonobacterales bacterium]